MARATAEEIVLLERIRYSSYYFDGPCPFYVTEEERKLLDRLALMKIDRKRPQEKDYIPVTAISLPFRWTYTFKQKLDDYELSKTKKGEFRLDFCRDSCRLFLPKPMPNNMEMWHVRNGEEKKKSCQYRWSCEGLSGHLEMQADGLVFLIGPKPLFRLALDAKEDEFYRVIVYDPHQLRILFSK